MMVVAVIAVVIIEVVFMIDRMESGMALSPNF
jgi:hypothetical protein